MEPLGLVPDMAVEHGFANGSECPHTARTITVADLQRLFEHLPANALRVDYRNAIVEHNVLHKNTLSTRQKSFRFLREFYALDRGVLLFRALRDLWDGDEVARPLLAGLCAIARDPIFRSTATVIVDASPGDSITPEQITEEMNRHYPDRFNESIAGKIGRNAASSWQQSGHLSGKVRKVRAQAECRPAAVAYALFLGYLCGARGDGLFDTLWCRLLDVPSSTVRNQALAASQAGWLEYRHSGQVTEITFNYLMREQD